MTDPTAAPPATELYLHVRVLIGVILGLSVARLVGGIAGFIQHPDRRALSWLHIGWVAWAMLNVITFWWWEFLLVRVPQWSFGLYAFIFVYASMYYLLAALLFPDDISEDGYGDYLLSRRVWFFGLIAVTEVLDVIDTWIKGDEHLAALGPAYAIRIVGFVVLCLLAMRTRNLIFHRIFVAAALVYEIGFFSRYFSSLG